MDSMSQSDRLRAAFEIGDHPLDLVSRQVKEDDGYAVERLAFVTAEGDAVRGVLTRPVSAERSPALLYIHAHGARYDIGADELLGGRPALLGPLGPEFARLGFVTLMIEMPAFGARAEPGESARTKACLWRGRSLAGQMVAEQQSAFRWLAARDDVIADRVGVFGLSMGATLGYWLAAVEPRVACVAHLCCYADFETLIESGAHDLHGVYLTIPGLLGIASNGVIAGMIAPRPQLIAVGDRDPLTPPAAVDLALAETRAAYARAGAPDALALVREAGSGHVETPAIRAAVFAFLERYLAG
ncbi:MAG TPA: dienelactone hydrolase family protein [Methylomirabilota bacterium]|nr:dienelactone hydrolase family protein [Methylomirabilota bacterium]